MDIASRIFLKETQFVIEAIWSVRDPMKEAALSTSEWVFLKLSPPIPELESLHTAVGLKISVPSAPPYEYCSGSRNNEGKLVVFLNQGKSSFSIGAPVRLCE